MTLAALVEEVLGHDLPVGVTAYDGSRAGPSDAPATLIIHSPDALRRILTAPSSPCATACPGSGWNPG